MTKDQIKSNIALIAFLTSFDKVQQRMTKQALVVPLLEVCTFRLSLLQSDLKKTETKVGSGLSMLLCSYAPSSFVVVVLVGVCDLSMMMLCIDSLLGRMTSSLMT